MLLKSVNHQAHLKQAFEFSRGEFTCFDHMNVLAGIMETHFGLHIHLNTNVV